MPGSLQINDNSCTLSVKGEDIKLFHTNFLDLFTTCMCDLFLYLHAMSIEFSREKIIQPYR